MESEPEVTVAIPTYNRASMLAVSLESALRQDFADLRIVVLDNASADDTEKVVRSFGDARIDYLRSDTNIGLFRNWNRAIEVNRSSYLCILQDDDEMQPDFVSRSVQALDIEPCAAFSYTHARFMDAEGSLLHRQQNKYVSAGRIHGLDLLHRIVAGDNWVIHPSSVMMRKSALEAVGRFDVAHSRHAIEFNLYFRLASQFDLMFIPADLVHVRLHEGQDHKKNTRGTLALAMLSERIDAIAHLMKSDRAANRDYVDWLSERLLALSMTRSELTGQLVPDLNLSWQERVEVLHQEIAGAIPRGERVILVDENHFGPWLFPDFDAIPFVERDGEYGGPPADDAIGIRELERLRSSRASYLLVCWPAFWWLDYYSELRVHLQSRYRCVIRNSRVVVYDLREAVDQRGDGILQPAETEAGDET